MTVYHTGLSGRIIRMIVDRPGLTTGEIAATLHRSTSQLSSMMDHLVSQGWVTARLTRGHGASGVKRAWYPTAHAKTTPYVGTPYTDTTPRVEQALQDAGGAMTIKELAQTLGRPYDTVRSALRTLIRTGAVEKYTGPDGTASYALTDPTDTWQPPTPYISAARAFALGLRR